MWRTVLSGLAICLLAPASAVLGVPSSVHLRSGAEVIGDLLDRNDDRVIIDLGYTVLSIPTEEILDLAPLVADDSPVEDHEFALFRTGGAARPASVSDNAARLGSAVVQVSTPTGLGSGFVIHPDGYVVTNAHVIGGEYSITVTVYEKNNEALEKRPFDNIRILAFEPSLDLALLKIEGAEDLRFATVPIGDSDQLIRGQTVFAIGSPLGLERTVSQGIVSLKHRSFRGRLYTQTTTQINPGNSGGPLFNLRGEVIGVNNMKAMMVGVEGVSFAIPSSILKDFLKNRDAYAFDERNPNSGYRYLEPPRPPDDSSDA